MKSLHTILFSLLVLSLLTSCGGDDTMTTSGASGGSRSTANNTNANKTGIAELDSRLEVPHITDTKNNTHLIRRVATYGVNYIIEWDNQKRSQRWAAFQMYNGNSGSNWNRNQWASSGNYWSAYNHNVLGYSSWDPFQPDPDLPEGIRTELEEYRDDNNYQRGHIVASADRLNSKEANEQTYYLSNIMPQTGACNTGTWLTMENQLRNWNNQDRSNSMRVARETLYVVKGGTIDNGQTNGFTRTGLLVPKYFFMAFLAVNKDTYNALAFIVEHANPNKSGTSLKNYAFTIDQLEQLTGIDFFCNLPDDVENETEKTIDLSFWKLN